MFDHISLVRYITAVEDSAKKWILLVNSVAEDIDLALSLSLSLSRLLSPSNLFHSDVIQDIQLSLNSWQLCL